MAVKTETQEKQTKEISFPCLMRSRTSGLVVLFTSNQKGTVIVSGSGWGVGLVRDDWYFADSGGWELSPPVTISNA